MRTPVIFCAALVAAGCTTAPQWQKEGVSMEAMQADMYTCRSEAPVEPRVQGPSGLPSGRGQGQSAAFETMADREAARMGKDERFVSECMRGKGYTAK